MAPAGYESWGKLYPIWYCTTYQALSGYCVIHSNTLRKYLSIPKRGVKSVVLYISMRYQAVGPVSSNTSRYKKKIQSDSSESQSYLTAPIRQHRQQSNSTNSPTSTVRQQPTVTDSDSSVRTLAHLRQQSDSFDSSDSCPTAVRQHRQHRQQSDSRRTAPTAPTAVRQADRAYTCRSLLVVDRYFSF